MNPNDGRYTLPATVALLAAIAVGVSMFLPWATASSTYYGTATESFVDMVSRATAWTVLDWLMVGGLVIGPLLGAWAAGARLLSPTSARVASQMGPVGFVVALCGFGLWFVEWGQWTNAFNTLGVNMGIGVFAGIAAAVVGLVASVAAFRSAPGPWVASPPAGRWSPSMVAPMAPSAPSQATAPTAWQGPVPAQPVAPAGVGTAAGVVGRISYVESGRASSLLVNAGDQLMIGRDVDARVRLSDPRVSRRHVMISWSGTGWSVRDLGATNPTRLLGASGTAQPIAGEIQISSGQLLIGDVLVTLFPAGA